MRAQPNKQRIALASTVRLGALMGTTLTSRAAGGGGTLQSLAGFMTNPAGDAIINAIGPLRQIATGKAGPSRRWLVIASGTAAAPGQAVQVQR